MQDPILSISRYLGDLGYLAVLVELAPWCLGDLGYLTRKVQTAWLDSGRFSLSTTYLGDLAFQNHRLQSSSSDGPSRSVRSKETLAILGPRKIAGGTRDHQGFEGFKVPWRSWVHGALPAKPENIIASSQISRLAIFQPDLLDAF